MLNLRRMLAEPKFIGLRQDMTLNEELDRLVALLRRQRRRHEPVEWLRNYDELECLRRSIADLESVLGRTAAGIAESLLLHAYPRTFRLADGQWDDGRLLLRHAACGAFALEDGPTKTILAELRIGVAKATAQQVRQNLVQAEFWWAPAEDMDDQAIYDAALHFEAVILDLARPEVYEVVMDPTKIGRALWLGLPSPSQGQPPDDWQVQARAIGASHGVNIDYFGRVTPTNVEAAAAEVSAQGIDLLIAWAPNVRPELQHCLDIYASSAGSERIIMLPEVRFDALQERLRMELMDAVGRLPPVVVADRPVIPESGVVYLQKRGTAGDHDVFDLRAGPCTHDQFERMGHADKGFKGVHRMFGRPPKAVHKCVASKCQAWMATFDP
jgi:hypothetical protein